MVKGIRENTRRYLQWIVKCDEGYLTIVHCYYHFRCACLTTSDDHLLHHPVILVSPITIMMQRSLTEWKRWFVQRDVFSQRRKGNHVLL